MSDRPKDLTPAEWRVMEIVWRLKRCAARDVYEECGERFGMAPSTVKTHLRRLAEKGHLRTTPVGNSFLYEPVRSRLRALYRVADSLMDRLRGESEGRVLAYLLKNSKGMSRGEIAELRELLDTLPADDEEDEA